MHECPRTWGGQGWRQGASLLRLGWGCAGKDPGWPGPFQKWDSDGLGFRAWRMLVGTAPLEGPLWPVLPQPMGPRQIYFLPSQACCKVGFMDALNLPFKLSSSVIKRQKIVHFPGNVSKVKLVACGRGAAVQLCLWETSPKALWEQLFSDPAARLRFFSEVVRRQGTEALHVCELTRGQ